MLNVFLLSESLLSITSSFEVRPNNDVRYVTMDSSLQLHSATL